MFIWPFYCIDYLGYDIHSEGNMQASVASLTAQQFSAGDCYSTITAVPIISDKLVLGAFSFLFYLFLFSTRKMRLRLIFANRIFNKSNNLSNT